MTQVVYCAVCLAKGRVEDSEVADQGGDEAPNAAERRGVVVGGCITYSTVTDCNPYSDSPHSHPACNQFRYIHLCPL